MKYLTSVTLNKDSRMVSLAENESILEEIICKTRAGDNFTDDEKIFWSRKQGKLFESYIAGKLCKHFNLIGWSCDKFVDDDGEHFNNTTTYGSTIHNPDLILECRSGHQFEVAVECKWTNDLRGFNLYNSYKYQDFEEDKGIKVFFALGVGNTGDDPAEVYLFPLSDSINEPYLIDDEEYMIRHKISDKKMIGQSLIEEYKALSKKK